MTICLVGTCSYFNWRTTFAPASWNVHRAQTSNWLHYPCKVTLDGGVMRWEISAKCQSNRSLEYCTRHERGVHSHFTPLEWPHRRFTSQCLLSPFKENNIVVGFHSSRIGGSFEQRSHRGDDLGVSLPAWWTTNGRIRIASATEVVDTQVGYCSASIDAADHRFHSIEKRSHTRWLRSSVFE